MSIDPFSGRNPSYCFLDLDPSKDAEDVIMRLQGYLIRGRPIKVNYDTEKRERSPQHIETRMWNGEMRSFDLSPTTTSAFVFDRYARSDARDHSTIPVEESRRLHVGGLSDISNQMFVNEEMRQLFLGFELQAVSKRIIPVHRDTKRPATGQCYCFVDLASANEAKAAISALDGTPTPYGETYKVNIAYGRQDRKVCREQLQVCEPATSVRRNLDGNWRSSI